MPAAKTGGKKGGAPPEERKGIDLLLPFLVVGTWAAFVIFGLAQESLTRTKFGPADQPDEQEQFKFTTFLVLLQSVGNALVAAVCLVFSGKNLSGSIPLREWLIVAVGYAGAHKFGLWSLLYIPFPLQVLLKSCKTIPVMIGGLLLDRTKTPKMKQILAVLILTAGIAIFMMFKPSKKASGGGGGGFEMNEDAMVGIGLVALALICDAIYGPYQDKIVNGAKKLKEENPKAPDAPSSFHLMFNMNFYQGVVSVIMLAGHVVYDVVATGKEPAAAVAGSELMLVAKFVEKHPEIIVMFLQFSLAMAFGNVFIYTLQRQYGSLVVTTTTTLRKFLSVLASALPVDGVCAYLPVLPEGLCGLAVFPGCAAISCASISGFGNEIVPPQWIGVVLVVLSKNIAGIVCDVIAPEKKKAE
eukprot:SAG22_NODE_2607_length_2390_cov_5.701004_2_plen_413_part_00